MRFDACGPELAGWFRFQGGSVWVKLAKSSEGPVKP